MLTTSTKPWNPNRERSLETDWDKIDLYSFLYNVNTINIDKNDISVTGKDYENATKREIVAEIIRTINCTHYNSLCGMRDIIRKNDALIKETEKRNKSIDICEKNLKRIELKLQKIDFLLNVYKITNKTPKILDFCDPTTAEPIHQINHGSSDHTSLLQEQNILCPNVEIANIEPITQTQALTSDSTNCDINNQTQISPAHITQNTHVQISSAKLRDKNKPKNEPQLKTFNATTSSTKQHLTRINADILHEIPTTQTIDGDEIKLKRDNNFNKMKKKKIKNTHKNNRKNKNKYKNKKQKVKQKRHQLKKQNVKQKENTLNINQINEMIQSYEFTNDIYQEFINQRHFHRSGLSAYEYYEEIYGKITDEKIKEWTNAYHTQI